MDRRGVVVVIDPDDRTRAAARDVADRSGCDLAAFDHATTLMSDVARERLLLAVELAGGMNSFEVLGAVHRANCQ